MNVQHRVNGRIEQRRSTDIVARLISFLLLFLTVVSSSAQGDNKELTLKWTDTGVYFGTKPEVFRQYLNVMLKSFPDEVNPVFPEIPPEGQILILMPENDSLPPNEEEWKQFSSYLYAGIKRRIAAALENGIYDFEIRTVQNISFQGGYWSLSQQERCIQFTSAFLEALSQVKHDFMNSYNVNIDGIVGSNAGHTATKTIPLLTQNPLDKLILIDGRAYVRNTIETVDVMMNKVALVNTAGDAPSFPDMIADHKGAKKVKYARPEIIATYVDPEGWNIIGFAHIAVMEPSVALIVKYFNCNKYTPSRKMSASEFIHELLELLDEPVTPLQEGEVFYRIAGDNTLFTGRFLFRHIDGDKGEITKIFTLTQNRITIKGTLEISIKCPRCCEMDANCCGAASITVPVTGNVTKDEAIAELSWPEESDEINKPEPGDFIFGLPRCIVSTEEGTFPAALRDNGKVLILKGCQ